MPYLTVENKISFLPFILFAEINSLSAHNLVAPYKLIGAAALSVLNAITFFTFDSGGRASVSCYDWSKESNNPKTIAVSIQSKLVADWVDSNYGTE